MNDGNSSTIGASSRTDPRWLPYPAYKDSGVEWLGEIPVHWEAIRVKSLEKNRGDAVQTGPFGAQLHASDYVDEGVPLILIRNVADTWIDDADIPKVSYEDAERLSVYRLEIGDIVFSRVGSIGRVALCTGREAGWLISGQMLRLRMRDPRLNSRYALYVFSSPAMETYIDLQSVGSTRESINTEILRNASLLIPPIPEQCAIAAFLDRETTRLDALVAKQERLIELLQEKRAALISHAVTKGLDPTVPMKDSGIPWLGQIPAHWQALSIRRLCKVRRGASPRPIDDPIYFDDEGEYAWVRISDVTASSKYLLETEQILSELGKSKSVPLEPGEIFLSIAATVGRPIITQIKCCIHDGFVYFVGLKQNREYLFYLLSGGELYKGLGKLGTQLNLNTDTIGDINIPIPPGEEQSAIAAFLDHETAKLDALIGKVRTLVERLQEYRTALISAAVTGKIDVRGERPVQRMSKVRSGGQE